MFVIQGQDYNLQTHLDFISFQFSFILIFNLEISAIFTIKLSAKNSNTNQLSVTLLSTHSNKMYKPNQPNQMYGW